MYPYLNVGPLHLGTFGLLLWLAAAIATVVLHRNFLRNGIDADALGIVAYVVIAGVIGAKFWHEFQDFPELRASLQQIALPGWGHPVEIVLGFLHWFQAGFAWYGGLLAGIATLLWQGRSARFTSGLKGTVDDRVGSLRMLDLAAPAAALGYGVGRIGCLTSGDGDYGINTTLPWGVRMRPSALVPPNPPDALVQPTPIYELILGALIFWLLWQLGKRSKPVGWLTGLYLVLMGVARFFVEFVRINPRIYWGMSNAQVAALGSVLAGVLLLVWAHTKGVKWTPEFPSEPRS
jgi:phosphatidylglycerol:prolipoprotein diacylglycerol transferase